MLKKLKKLVRHVLRVFGYELIGARDYAVIQRQVDALNEHVSLLRIMSDREAHKPHIPSDIYVRDGRLLADEVSNRHAQSLSVNEAYPPAEQGAPELKPDAVGPDARFWPSHYPFPVLEGFDLSTVQIRIVDVGAEALDFEEDVYAPLIRAVPCSIVGFDPFATSEAVPKSTTAGTVGSPSKRVLPYFIGLGGEATFHLNNYSPTSSLFPTNEAFASQFLNLAELCRTKKSWPVSTKRLDEIPEAMDCDFLKVDVQGGDYDVIASGESLLEKTLFVHIEVEFAQLYSGQKLFPDIDAFMQAHGFELIDLVKMGWNNYKAMPSIILRSRLLWADAIYMKKVERISEMDCRALLRAALIAHVNYRKYDLAAHLIAAYDKKENSALLPVYTASFID